MSYGEHHLMAYDEEIGRSREFTCEELERARGRSFPPVSIAPGPFEYGEMWRREANKQKERAELAERKLAILTQTIHEAWNETKEQGG